ncbi:MAG TPA: O-antigen ligase family protein, partial [Pyrinomonadaceae bacterium]|nr:O-antigen ligase family protein [Pyrinomonadaceae bacterium]
LLPVGFLTSLDASATFYFELRMIVYLTFFAACLTFIDSEARLTRMVNFIIVFGAVMGFYGILQRLASPEGIYGLRHPAQAIPFGPFVNQHHFAALMEMTGGITLGLLFGETTSRDRRILLATAAIIMGAAVGFTGSRGGMLSFAATLGCVLLFRFMRGGSAEPADARKRLAIAAAGLGLLMVVFLLVAYLGGNDPLLRGSGVALADVDVSTGRFHFWPIALRIFAAHPVIGAGLDSFSVAFTRYDTWPGLFRVEQAHNDYLQILADAGILGFVCLASFIYLLFSRGLAVLSKSHDERRYMTAGALAGCFGIMVHSFFDFPLRTPSNAFFFLLLVAIATIPIYGQQRRRRRSRSSAR